MSRFSDSLNEIIKEYEPLNIYSIAKEIGCDRSWLQKVVGGDRKMNFEFIRPLCDLLLNHLSPAEVSELYEQFAQDYFGNEKYEVVKYIYMRMNHMGQREEKLDAFIAAEQFEVESLCESFLVPEETRKLVVKIYQMLQEEFEDAGVHNREPVIYLYVPSYWTYLRALLIVLCNREERYKNLDFKCVFSGYTMLQESDYARLEDFISAYGLAMYHLNVYDIMEAKGSHIQLDLLPYYIITKKKALFISEKGDISVALYEQKLIDSITKKYLSVVKEKSLFFGKLDESIYLNRITSVKIENEKSYVIGNHMCTEAFLGHEAMQKFVGNQMAYPDLAMNTAVQFYKNIQLADLNMVFASESVLQLFSGKCLSKEEMCSRLQLLEALYEHYVAHPEKAIHVFDSKRYRFAKKVHLNLLVEKTIIALDYNEADKTLFEKNMAVLLHPKVVENFRDFFDYFTNSSICMNREHSLQMMKMCIDTKRKELCDSIV